MRAADRADDALRSVAITPNYLDYAEGSAFVRWGKTWVLCAATVKAAVPAWLEGRGSGWVTGEYALLPRSTATRTRRETRGLSGRTEEIRRLIGRALRSLVNLKALGERTIIVDCDVIQADGGTRAASITGGFVALARALRQLVDAGLVDQEVFGQPVAAVSVGLVEGKPLLDLCYEEDSRAEADFSVVMNAAEEFVEIQGAAERRPFTRDNLGELLSLAQRGIRQVLGLQQRVLHG